MCHADEFIVQPPFDPSFTMKSGKTAYIIHYTYGNDYDPQGNMVYGKGVSKFFHWDKRDYTYVYPPQRFPLPPDEVRWPPAVSWQSLCVPCRQFNKVQG